MAINEANPTAAQQNKNPRVRTWGGTADRPVVATAPKPYAPSASMNTQQNIRAADAYASSIPYVSGAKQEADRQAEADKIAAEILGGQSYGGTGTRATPFQNALAMLGGGSGGGSGSGTSENSARMSELAYQKQKDKAQRKHLKQR